MTRLGDEMHALREGRNAQEALIAELGSRVARIEARIGSEGGAFARNRETLLQQRADLRARISEHENTLRQLCGALLPFTLVPTLSAALKEQLLAEEETAHLAMGRRMLETVRQELAQRLNAA